MRTLPNLLKSRHGVYYLRLYHDRRELKISLGTKDWALAKLLVLQFHSQRAMSDPFKRFEVDIATGTFKTNGTPEDAKALAAFLDRPDIAYRLKKAAEAPPVAPVGTFAPVSAPTRASLKPFVEVVEEYLTVKKLNNTAKTLKEKQSTYDEFSSIFPNIDTNYITKDTAVAFKNRLLKNGAGNSILNKRISFLKDLIAYAIDHGYHQDANPFLNLSVDKVGADSISYAEFTDEELKTIFNASSYLSHMKQPNYRWLPVLSLFSGARLNELAGLRLSEIYQSSGVWVMYIPRDRAKNKNSVREIPIHKTLIELGFLSYVEQVRSSKPFNQLVFPELVDADRYRQSLADKTKIDYAKNGGRAFAEYLDLPNVNIVDRKKVFHSFRSTFINRLTNVNGTHPAHIMGIVGHMKGEKIDFSGVHFKVYQNKKPVEYLKQAIDRLNYPFLDLNFLKHI